MKRKHFLWLFVGIFCTPYNEAFSGIENPITPVRAAYYEEGNPIVAGMMNELFEGAASQLRLPFLTVKTKDFAQALVLLKNQQVDFVVGPVTRGAPIPGAHYLDSYVPKHFVLVKKPLIARSFLENILEKAKLFFGHFFFFFAGLCVSFGFLFWLAERRSKASEMHRTKLWRGWFLSSVYCFGAFSIFGSVDGTNPKTHVGRLLAITMVLVGLFGVSEVISNVVSNAAALNQKSGPVEVKLPELRGKRIAYFGTEESREILEQAKGVPEKFQSIEEALLALENKKVNMVLGDQLLLESYLHKSTDSRYSKLILSTLKTELVAGERSYYFLIADKNPLESDFNQAFQTLRILGRTALIVEAAGN